MYSASKLWSVPFHEYTRFGVVHGMWSSLINPCYHGRVLSNSCRSSPLASRLPTRRQSKTVSFSAIPMRPNGTGISLRSVRFGPTHWVRRYLFSLLDAYLVTSQTSNRLLAAHIACSYRFHKFIMFFLLLCQAKISLTSAWPCCATSFSTPQARTPPSSTEWPTLSCPLLASRPLTFLLSESSWTIFNGIVPTSIRPIAPARCCGLLCPITTRSARRIVHPERRCGTWRTTEDPWLCVPTFSTARCGQWQITRWP